MNSSSVIIAVAAGAADRGAKHAEVDRKRLLGYAPPMPDGFYGAVTYTFQSGVVTMVTVEEKIRP